MNTVVRMLLCLSTTLIIGCVAEVDGEDAEAVNEVKQELVFTCTGDNDWSGRNPCFLRSKLNLGSWTFTTSNGYYGDMRYSTSKYAAAEWVFGEFSRDGFVQIEVYIPSTNATAVAEYEVNCGHPMFGVYTVRQIEKSNEWVRLGGGMDVFSGMQCSVLVYRPKPNESTSKLAMDAIRYTLTY